MGNPAFPKAAPAKPPRPTRPDYPHQARPTPALCSRRGCYARLDTSSWADRQALDVMAVFLRDNRHPFGRCPQRRHLRIDAAHALKETTTVAASHKMSI
jgi:hypothetical protein